MPLVKQEFAGDSGGDELNEEETWLDKFFFQQRHGKLNVRKLARIDLNEIVENVDIATLHEVLENIAFCNLKAGDLQTLSDGMIVKAFRIAQLIIEYLINLQNSLYARLDQSKEDLSVLNEELQQFRQDNVILADENDLLRKDIKRKRKALATFEYVLSVHGPSSPSLQVALSNALKHGKEDFLEASVCATCGKAFSTREFLRKHCKRRNHVMVSEIDDQENTSPNIDMSTLLNDQVIAKLQGALDESAKRRESDIQAAVERTRAQERQLYEEQLSLFKEDRRLHEQRLESHFKTQLLEQQNKYEQRIASMQSKIEVVEQFQSTFALEAQRKEETLRLERIEREIALNQRAYLLEKAAKKRNASSEDEDEDEIPPPITVSSDVRAHELELHSLQERIDMQNSQMKVVLARNFVRVLVSVEASRFKILKTRALSRWKMYCAEYKVRFAQRQLEETVAAAKSKEEEKSNSETNTQNAVKRHVAESFSSPGSSQTPISEDELRDILARYIYAQQEHSITPEEALGMEHVDALLDTKASLIESQFKIQPQNLNNFPIPEKPYIRSRWDHRRSEIRSQQELIQQQLLERMAEFDPELPSKDTLQEQQFGLYMSTLDHLQSTNPDKPFRRTLKAVKGLTKDLITNCYQPPPYLDYMFETEEEVYDDLLEQALVPMHERNAVASKGGNNKPAPVSPRSTVYSETFSDSEEEDDATPAKPPLVPRIRVLQTADDHLNTGLSSESSIDASPLPPPPPAFHIQAIGEKEISHKDPPEEIPGKSPIRESFTSKQGEEKPLQENQGEIEAQNVPTLAVPPRQSSTSIQYEAHPDVQKSHEKQQVPKVPLPAVPPVPPKSPISQPATARESEDHLEERQIKADPPKVPTSSVPPIPAKSPTSQSFALDSSEELQQNDEHIKPLVTTIPVVPPKSPVSKSPPPKLDGLSTSFAAVANTPDTKVPTHEHAPPPLPTYFPPIPQKSPKLGSSIESQTKLPGENEEKDNTSFNKPNPTLDELDAEDEDDINPPPPISDPLDEETTGGQVAQNPNKDVEFERDDAKSMPPKSEEIFHEMPAVDTSESEPPFPNTPAPIATPHSAERETDDIGHLSTPLESSTTPGPDDAHFDEGDEFDPHLGAESSSLIPRSNLQELSLDDFDSLAWDDHDDL